MARLVEVKSLGGANFVRPDRVVAVETSPTGKTVIMMEGGMVVNSSEPTKVVAARLEAAMNTSTAMNGEATVNASEPRKDEAPPPQE
ncbi:MAG: hypothetical protein ACHQAY_11720 [Hyphomicrobiales bacterium]